MAHRAIARSIFFWGCLVVTIATCSCSDVCVEETFSFSSARNITIVSRVWRTKDTTTSTKALVFLQHGFHWHSGYFGPLASDLVEDGYVVMAMDLQGHGRSGSLDHLRAYADRFDHFVEDLEQGVEAFVVRESKRAGVAQLPCFLYGESMGGTIALRSSLRPNLQGMLTGVILSAPVIRIDEEMLPPPWMLWVGYTVAYFLPRMRVPSTDMEGTFDQSFGDKQAAQQARADGLVVFDPPRLRTAVEIIATCEHLAAAIEQVSVPLLVLHGTADARTSHTNSQDLITRAASVDKEVKLYDGAAHQLLQDVPAVTEAVKADIRSWIAKRV